MPDVFTKPANTEENSSSPASPHPVTLLNETPRKPGLFTSFCPRPTGITFENQESEEEIILLLRRHFVTNLSWILAAGFFLLLGAFLPVFLRSDVFSSLFFIPDTYILVVTILYYLVIWGYILVQFATWFYQVGLVTNLRIIDVDFNSLLSRNIAFTELGDIVDVEVIQGGILHSTFNYGTVQLQTEGLKANFEFTNIPRPADVADVISDLIRDERKKE